jgi:adenine-specific DNA-methyltransferase
MSRYSNYTKEQLIQKIKQLESKKYGLVWDDEKEPEKVAVECQNNIPILKKIDEKTIKTDITKPTNILIEGDNYHALQVLNYTHKGQIDVIYIDPPYNTGNKDFKYNDSFVDKEDGYRHSKWLNFMSKRLKLAHNLLKDSGVIFISIDDNEVAQLRLLCDDVFGEENFITTIHWRRSESQNNNSKTLSVVAEYILCYTKNIKYVPLFNKLEHTAKAKKEYRYNDDNGLFRRGTIIDKSRGSNSFEIVLPNNQKVQIENSIRTKSWLLSEISKNMIYWTKTWTPYWKIYLDSSDGQIASNWFDNIAVNEDASDEISLLSLNFSFSKPKELIIYLLKLVNFNENSTILDFFAGSGTTGHAVLELNREDGGNRQFILCTNNENNICTEVTYPRVSKVINGYTTPKGVDIEGLSGNLGMSPIL